MWLWQKMQSLSILFFQSSSKRLPTYCRGLGRALLNMESCTISRLKSKWIIFFFIWYKIILYCRCDTWHSVPSWTSIFCYIELPTLQPLSLQGKSHLEFSNQLQSSRGSHAISFSNKKVLMFCMRCTHNPGSMFLWDAVIFLLKIIPCSTCSFWI